MASERGNDTPTHSADAVPPQVMTIDDLASYLQLSKSSLYKLAQGGRIPAQKVGKHWRFHKIAIDQWLGGQPIVHPIGGKK